MTKKWYIEKTGIEADIIYWWKKGNHGYTPDIKEAKVFTEEKAKEICSQIYTDKRRWPKKYIDNKIIHRVNKEDCNYDDVLDDL